MIDNPDLNVNKIKGIIMLAKTVQPCNKAFLGPAYMQNTQMYINCVELKLFCFKSPQSFPKCFSCWPLCNFLDNVGKLSRTYQQSGKIIKFIPHYQHVTGAASVHVMKLHHHGLWSRVCSFPLYLWHGEHVKLHIALI